MKKYTNFTPAQKKEISDIIDSRLPGHIANLVNADVRTIVCSYKSEPNSNALSTLKETQVLIYKNEILKVFCTYSTANNNCTRQQNKSKICYLHYAPKSSK